jgi:hypothetical protein
VLSYLNKLYKGRPARSDYATNTVTCGKRSMSSGKGLMYFDNSGFRIDFEAALRTIDPDARYEVIPTLTNPWATPATPCTTQLPDQHYVISEFLEEGRHCPDLL